MESISKTISGIFALTGFSVAIAIGLAASNPASTVLLRAMVCLLACMIVGRIAGFVARMVVNEHLNTYRAIHPVPDLSTVSQPQEPENSTEGNLKG